MADKKPAKTAPKGVAVYITASCVKTSIGVAHHGETISVPAAEAGELKAKGFAK